MPKQFHHHSDRENILKISDTESIKLKFRCSKQSASPVSWFSQNQTESDQKHHSETRELSQRANENSARDACKDPKTRMTNSRLVLVLYLAGLESGVSPLNQSKIEV